MNSSRTFIARQPRGAVDGRGPDAADALDTGQVIDAPEQAQGDHGGHRERHGALDQADLHGRAPGAQGTFDGEIFGPVRGQR
jgi:hypothetical protein